MENKSSKDGAKEGELLITYLFDAPRELVFKAWTDPDQLKCWYAPEGCTIYFKNIEVVEGGTFHSCIHNPKYGDCWIKGVYREVLFPERLVYAMILTDEAGNAVKSTEVGKSADWPTEILTTVIFNAVGNKTELTLHQTVPDTAAKQSGAYQSWIDMFNRLNRLSSKLFIN